MPCADTNSINYSAYLKISLLSISWIFSTSNVFAAIIADGNTVRFEGSQSSSIIQQPVVDAKNGGHIIADGEVNLIADDSIAIKVQNNSKVDLLHGGTINISKKNEEGTSVFQVNGNNSTLNIKDMNIIGIGKISDSFVGNNGNSVTIENSRMNAGSLQVSNGATLSVKDSLIEATHNNYYTINVKNHDSRANLILTNTTINNMANSDNNWFGAININESNTTITDSILNTTGYGIQVANSDVTLTNTTINAGKIGIIANGQKNKILLNNVTINSEVSGVTAIGGSNVLIDNITINNNNTALNTQSSNSYIDAKNVNVNAMSANANTRIIYALDTSQIDVNGFNINIAGSDSAKGFYASGFDNRSSNINMSASNGTLINTSKGGEGIRLQVNHNNFSLNNSRFEVNDGIFLTSITNKPNDQYNTFNDNGSIISADTAFKIRGGNLTINLDNTTITSNHLFDVAKFNDTIPVGKVILNAKRSTLTGDIMIANASLNTTQLSLSDNSRLEGTINGLQSLQLDNSDWTITGNSQIGELILNDATLNFSHNQNRSQSANEFKTITIDGNLTGSGKLIINTQLGSNINSSNQLDIKGNVNGLYTLLVADSGYEPEQSGYQHKVISTSGGEGVFTLHGDYVDVGAYRYTLAKSGSDWVLSNSEYNSNVPVDPPANNLSNGTNATIGMRTAAQLLWDTQTSALANRMNELRLKSDNGGLWLRSTAHKYDVSPYASRDFSQHTYTQQLGADKQLLQNKDQLFAGAFIGYGWSNPDFDSQNSGKIKNYLMGSYLTYLDERGLYIDSSVRFSRMSNEINIVDNIGRRNNSHYKHNIWGLSVNAGQQFLLGNSWLVEPQLGLAMSWIEGANYTMDNGLKVDLNNHRIAELSTGVLIARHFSTDNGNELQPYVKVDYITDLVNDEHINVNDHRFAVDNMGNRWLVGAGITWQAAKQHHLSMDMEYAKGQHITMPLSLNIGYRYSW